MPLLHKKLFTPERLPRDLRPDEEVFVCKATQEVFRDYEKFFNRHFLCNSYVWTCSLTGQSHLTYTQAVESETEAQKLLDSFPQCYKRAVLELVHHVRRTNIRSLGDELLAFFKERYVVGERLELVQTTSSGAKVLRPIQVVKVIPPDPKSPPTSPVRVSVISLPPSVSPSGPMTTDHPTTTPSGVVFKSPPQPLTNGLPDTASPGEPSPNCFKTPKALTPRTPLTPQAALNPSGYKYVVETLEEPSVRMTVGSKQLSRPKGQLHPKKLKLFLRNALQRLTEKHPFRVKEEYVQRFDLGVSSVSSDPLPSPSPSRSRKRTLSQASLDSFLSPNEEGKRSRPASLDTSTKTKRSKKTPHKSSRRKSGSKSGSKSKTPSSTGGHKHRHKTPLSPNTRTPRSPGVEKVSGKTPRSQMEALKVLNKAKKYRQMDLKKSVVKKSGLSREELEELERRADEERRHLQQMWEAEKIRRREERLEKVRLTQELKRLERLKQKELMKPREDTLCIDSKPLPQPTPVTCLLPPELFGEAVMVLEFLHSFGPLFNIREVIREGITFEKLERCLVSSDTDTVLFDVVRFLMQAVFAAMEEDHENVVNLKDAVPHGEEVGEGEAGRGEEGGGGEQQEMERVEVEEKEEGEGEEKPLDIQVESVCRLSVTFAQWSHQTQRLPLSQLVVDPYTCSEVLRLHLLASGGYSKTANRKRVRSYRRGGYTDGDNPAIALRLRRPDLLSILGRTSMYDLPPQDKLEILSTLCTQLLTFSVGRDHIEECCVHGKRARRKIREIQLGEERRKRESRQQRTKEKKEKIKKELNGTISIESAAQPPPPAQPPKGDATSPETVPPPVLTGSSGGQGKEEATETVAPEETEEERKERIKEELSELHEELAEAMSSVSLQPLGSDRHHYRYWMFPNLSGLFVEDTGLSQMLNSAQSSPPPLIPLPPSSSFITTSPSLPTSMVPEMSAPHPPQLIQLSSSELQPMDVDPALPQPVPRPSPPANPSVSEEVSQENMSSSTAKWSCYFRTEEVEELLMALDVRGVREKALREALTLHKSNLLSTIDKCVFKTERKMKQLSPPGTQALHYDSGDQYLELYLREQILDTEEKIHLGNLGHLRGSQTRDEWRNVIENSGAAALVNSWREKAERAEQGESEAMEGSGSSEDPCPSVSPAAEAGRVKSGTPTSATDPSVRILSQALLDIEAGLEPKFLMAPLGYAVDSKKYGVKNPKKQLTVVKEADICREQWRASLSQATSFSQLFLHLTTLERAIMWSRSLMNVRCRICRRKGGDEYMLLCDGCDHGYHTYCLKPPLSHVPEGDWFCHSCSPVTPVKPRKRAQHVTFQEVESSDSEKEGEGEGEEGESEEEEEEEDEESDEEEVMSTRSLRSQRRGRPVSGHRRSGRLNQKHKKATTAPTKKTRKLVQSKAKKPSARQQAVPAPTMKAKKQLNMDPLRSLTVSKAESIVSAIIELRCSRGSRGGGGGAVRREQRGLEMQLCQALWEEVNNHDDSWPFTEPVKKKEYPDYHDVVAEPTDLKTIRSKIKRGDYVSLDGLVADMELMFSNCQLFHRRHSEIGKAGVALKKFFDKRCSDLGLKDLELVASGSGTARLRSSRRRK